MKWLLALAFLFAVVCLSSCWYKCTDFRVQQSLCNGTSTQSESVSDCKNEPHPTCYYDYDQNLCICKYVAPCTSGSLQLNSAILVNFTFDVLLDLGNSSNSGKIYKDSIK